MTTDDMEKRVLQLFDAAQDIPSDVRADWLREQAGEDTALLARLEGLLAADAAAANVLRTGGAKQAFEDEVGTVKRAGAYRVTDLIGRGGMGDVYKGQRDQGDFEHEVAIKVIKPGLLSKSVEARLKAERQILADLNHPNIARLFDGGELEDGSPYIIMEYIEGEPVTHWVEAQKLSLPDRLWLFCDLCRAVQYAHQNLIVHRDITPSNVLVTKEGVIKLIDFGIAKPQDVFVDVEQDLQVPSSEFVGSKPSLASLSFTPGYAAPERAEGAKPNILSDIFSLGKLLAHIIPDGRIKRDLRAIVSKATEANPAERYVSVDNLRDEVVRYLNDYPVEAVHGGGGYRFSKFFKRRWLTVTGVSAVAAGLVGGLAVTTGLYKEAEAARVEADDRFEDVRELAKTMMFDIYDTLEQVPQSSGARLTLANAAQVYMDDLSQAEGASNEVKLETANGLIRLAIIQGSPSQGARFDSEQAKVNLDQAARILLPLVETHPETVSYRSALGKAYNDKASIHAFIDQEYDKAGVVNEAALELLKPFADSVSGEALEFQLTHMNAEMGRMIILDHTGKLEEAVEIAQSILPRHAEIAARHGENTELKVFRLRVLRSLGGTLLHLALRQGGVEDNPELATATANRSIGYLTEAVDLVDVLIQQDPNNPNLWRSKAGILSHLGFIRSLINQGEPALENYLEAIGLHEKLVAHDPDNSRDKQLLSNAQGESVTAYVSVGDFEKAEEAALAHLARNQERLLLEPDLGAVKRNVLVSYYNIITVYSMWGKLDKLCAQEAPFREIIDRLESAGQMADRDLLGNQANLDGFAATCH